MKRLYVALLEVEAIGVDSLPGGGTGAAVRAYVCAASELVGRSMFEEASSARRLRLVEIEWIVDDDDVEWPINDGRR